MEGIHKPHEKLASSNIYFNAKIFQYDIYKDVTIFNFLKYYTFL